MNYSVSGGFCCWAGCFDEWLGWDNETADIAVGRAFGRGSAPRLFLVSFLETEDFFFSEEAL